MLIFGHWRLISQFTLCYCKPFRTATWLLTEFKQKFWAALSIDWSLSSKFVLGSWLWLWERPPCNSLWKKSEVVPGSRNWTRPPVNILLYIFSPKHMGTGLGCMVAVWVISCVSREGTRDRGWILDKLLSCKHHETPDLMTILIIMLTVISLLVWWIDPCSLWCPGNPSPFYLVRSQRLFHFHQNNYMYNHCIHCILLIWYTMSSSSSRGPHVVNKHFRLLQRNGRPLRRDLG